TAEPWGTSVSVQLAGVAPGTRCRLVALGAGGRREIAGTWRASYDGTAKLAAATAIPVADLRGFVVERDGPPPVRRLHVGRALPLPPADDEVLGLHEEPAIGGLVPGLHHLHELLAAASPAPLGGQPLAGLHRRPVAGLHELDVVVG